MCIKKIIVFIILVIVLTACESKSAKISEKYKRKTLKQNPIKEEKYIYKEEKEVSIKKEKLKITNELLLKLAKTKIKRFIDNIKEIELPAKCFFLYDSVGIYTQNSMSSKLLNYGEMLKPYNILSHDHNWLKIQFNGLEGYVKNKTTIYLTNDYLVPTIGDPVGKHITDYIYEVWENTNNQNYEKALTGIKDSTIIHKFQRISVGSYLISIPFKLNLYLNAMENLQYKSPSILNLSSSEKSYLLIQIWEKIGEEYGSAKISYKPQSTANIVSKFQIADIYANKLFEPDSSIQIYLNIVSKYPNTPIGGDEWNSKSDIFAFLKFIQIVKSLDINDDKLVEYYKTFLKASSSEILDAIIRLQINKYLFKTKQYSKAEENLKSIITGAPLFWTSFKTSGDIRGAAIWQWQYLGSININNDYSIESLSKIEEITSDKLMIAISKYLIAKMHKKGKNTKLYKEYLHLSLKSISECEDCPKNLSLNPLPQNWTGPHFNVTAIKDSLNKQ